MNPELGMMLTEIILLDRRAHADQERQLDPARNVRAHERLASTAWPRIRRRILKI